MKQLITVTFEAASHNQLKSDTGMVLRSIGQALSKTNGSEIHVHLENGDNAERMYFLTGRLNSWSHNNAAPPGKPRRKAQARKGILQSMIDNAKDQVIRGLTGDI